MSVFACVFEISAGIVGRARERQGEPGTRGEMWRESNYPRLRSDWSLRSRDKYL